MRSPGIKAQAPRRHHAPARPRRGRRSRRRSGAGLAPTPAAGRYAGPQAAQTPAAGGGPTAHVIIVEAQLSLQREQHEARLLDDPPVDALRAPDGHDDGHEAQDDEVPGAVLAGRLSQDVEDDGADDRALDRADATDDQMKIR